MFMVKLLPGTRLDSLSAMRRNSRIFRIWGRPFSAEDLSSFPNPVPAEWRNRFTGLTLKPL